MTDHDDPHDDPLDRIAKVERRSFIKERARRWQPAVKEKVMTKEQCAKWLASRPTGGRAEPKVAPPAPAGPPPVRGVEFIF